MNTNQAQALIKEFCQNRDWDQFHDPKELAIGMSTEANELLSLFRFLDKDQTLTALNEKKELIEDELMDVLFFVLRFAQLYNVDIDEAFKRKMALNDSKYPVSLVKGKNKKYDEY
jgi:NTP pyrophosphatase (non-canonical NTP hydrolase)